MALAHIDHDTVLRFVAAFTQMTFPLSNADAEAWVRNPGFDPGDQPWYAIDIMGQAGLTVDRNRSTTNVAGAQVTITDATDDTTAEELEDAFAEQATKFTELLGKPTGERLPTMTLAHIDHEDWMECAP